MSEYLTDLNINDCKIYQDTDDYAFSSDSVFLANLAKISQKDRVLDLGTGSSIIATLIAIKKHAKQIVGIELQPSIADMAKRSVLLNGLENQIEIICGDIKNINKIVPNESFDKVVCNPPYFEALSFPDNCSTSRATAIMTEQNIKKSISRMEGSATLADFITSAKWSLKFSGEFYIILKVARLCDLMFLLRQNNLEPKHITFIYPKLSVGVDTVIVRAKKGGKPGLSTDTLIVHDGDGKPTNQTKELYL